MPSAGLCLLPAAGRVVRFVGLLRGVVRLDLGALGRRRHVGLGRRGTQRRPGGRRRRLVGLRARVDRRRRRLLCRLVLLVGLCNAAQQPASSSSSTSFLEHCNSLSGRVAAVHAGIEALQASRLDE